MNSCNIYIVDTSIVSPLGLTVDDNMQALYNQASSINLIDSTRFMPKPILASVLEDWQIEEFKKEFHTAYRFDALLLKGASEIKKNNIVDFSQKDTMIILSTTKGNVELLNSNVENEAVQLCFSAKVLQQYFNHPNEVMIVSNACISGVSASIVAYRYLQTHRYKHILVIGCDVVTEFVLSGFSSFHAIAKKSCRPFDKNREGVVLGEACGALVFSNEIKSSIELKGGCISNDANHISGPSKTGDELAHCINQTLLQSEVKASDIDFISAHGTATLYNDEMESKAIDSCGLSQVPVFSVKANVGHTLGASGVIETIVSMACLLQNKIMPSKGYTENGVSGHINVSTQVIEKEIKYAIKTSSGFGGCNASLLLAKV